MKGRTEFYRIYLQFSMWTLSDVTMMRPQKWHRIMSTYCQTNVSLIKDYVPLRIIGIITVRQAFETMMKIFTNIQWAN